MPEWKKAGHLVVSNIANIENLNKLEASYVLLDLRSKGQIEKGHIPKAVAVPDGKADALKAQFPAFKGATIILYNQDVNMEAATAAFKTVAQSGYRDVSILEGGIAAWEKAGKEIAKGPAASQIKYVRKLLPGEIEVAEFRALLEKPSKEKIVIDVRGEAEFKEDGGLPGAINIPLEALESRLAEIPKDKNVVLQCNTGVRSEMAYNILKKAGLKPLYLKATIEYDKEKKGQFKITE